MKCAIEHGAAAVVKWLHANDCPWSDEMLCAAAFNAHTDLFKWLHENDCPADWHTGTVQLDDIYWCAAAGGSVECLEYCAAQHSAWSAADLTVLLDAAGIWNRLDAAKWLRERGAEWPAVLRDSENCDDEMIQWARQQGCTSPEYLHQGAQGGHQWPLVVMVSTWLRAVRLFIQRLTQQ